MSRITLGLCCLFYGLLASFSASAAPLVLQDKEAGYSISFSAGWQTVPEGLLKFAVEAQAKEMGLSDPDAGRAQGAMIIDGKTGFFTMYMIISFPLDVLDGHLGGIREAAKGDRQMLDRFKQEMEKAMLETGASILDSQTVEKGYCQNSSERDASLPVGQLMFRRLCVRFTDSAMITYTGVHPGAPSDTFDADFQTIIDSVQFTR